MNSLLLNTASLLLPDPLRDAVKFCNDNKSRLDECIFEGKRLLKTVNAECSDQGAFRTTVIGLNQLAQNQALRELNTRSVTAVPSVLNDDFIQKAREAVEAHAKEESTKRDLGILTANLDALFRELRVELQKSTPPLPLNQVWGFMVLNRIDAFFKNFNTEVFGS
ncbi:MAG: hypothetical protein LBJ75_04370 [Puniceicoccales bacterium]|jgi:hypothetical protein|nr:hypothetical protein [Puniceicoccales bacterium]